MTARNNIITGIAFSLLAMGAAAGCHAQASQKAKVQSKAPTAAHVALVAATTRTWPRTLTLTGTLNANRDSDVAADAAGKVIATYVERGSVVKQGAPLVALDRRSAALAQEQAQAQAAIATTQLELAKTECDRADRLFREGAINKAAFDRAHSECDAAKLRAEAAATGARIAGKSVGDAVVRAPFSGMIVEKMVTEGEYVRPDSRVVRLVQMDTLRLELAVPEAALAQITASQDVKFRVGAFGQQTFSGRIRYVGSAVRRESRDLLVEAVVQNQDGKLRPGMFATADVTVGESQHVVVPASAVKAGNDSQDDRVFVFKDGKLEERLVHVAGKDGDVVAVARGLAAGEQLVADAAGNWHDGQPAAAAQQ
ncbi:MAG: efflux RND transporter periplasmic adaptor subunit [Deltaproteobacteria bacterium]|nr:efflux RND transporter periplasmic adaptor subunit [Deltaproteobacteria bacterium]